MTIKELNKYLNKYVKIEIDKDVYIGTLEINEYHDTWYNLPEHHFSFKASLVKRVTVIKDKKNKTPEEIKEWLLANCIDKNNDINLSNLDFSDFDGNIKINNLKVRKHLYQNNQQVGGHLYQQNQECNNSIFQDNQQAECIYGEKNEELSR